MTEKEKEKEMKNGGKKRERAPSRSAYFVRQFPVFRDTSGVSLIAFYIETCSCNCLSARICHYQQQRPGGIHVRTYIMANMKRERETDRQTETETERQREADRQTDRDRDKHRDR